MQAGRRARAQCVGKYSGCELCTLPCRATATGAATWTCLSALLSCRWSTCARAAMQWCVPPLTTPACCAVLRMYMCI